MRIIRLAAAAAATVAFSLSASAQDKYEVKVAEFVGPQHFMTKWLVQWGEKLEKASGGRLAFKHFPGGQMAPAPAHYDLARSGQADGCGEVRRASSCSPSRGRGAAAASAGAARRAARARRAGRTSTVTHLTSAFPAPT